MSRLITGLVSIGFDDELLNRVGSGDSLSEIPKEFHDDLTKVLVGWVREVRDTPWTLPSSPLPGS